MVKPKVLYIIDTLKGGGAEMSTLQIAANLKNFDPIICTVYEGDTISHLPAFKGLRIINIKSHSKYGFAQNARKFSKILKLEQPALVISSLFKSNIIARLAMATSSIPLVGTFVSDEYSSLAYHGKTLKQKVFFLWRYALDFITIRSVSHIISNSEAIKISNCKKLLFPLSKVSVVYRGRPIPDRHSTITSKGDNMIKFLSVGRLLKNKGLVEMVNAFIKVHSNYPHTILEIAGEGPLRTELEAIISDKKAGDYIKLLGYVTNVDSFFMNCDVFIFPSHFEGFSGALIESMMAGNLIICSNITMNLEAVKDGESALVFERGNQLQLENLLSDAMKNLSSFEYMRLNAMRTARSRFSLKHSIAEYEKIYKFILTK